ncbi:hypothetical protein FH972_025588 [Carpinus fangiana]|uniref:mannan endo-1,6-alpha-mannosidase n=1 Tax=Carpinus fangiana TaxID=176857 RepID=A0A5N6L1Q8_9ROSI|nr:hypothetical protein FH972_025588 [Carpinus fangiana]
MAWQRLAAASLLAFAVSAIDLDINDPDSVKHAAFITSHGMMSYYSGNESGQTPGYLPGSGTPEGYYWWEGGAMFGSLIDYWYYTGDSTYNDVLTQGMLFQVGVDENYQPDNASTSLGNDDQAFWAMSAMKAAELRFPNPPEDKPQWVPLVQTVFAYQVGRWDTKTCGGGLRWQVFQFNNGYDYKNAISTGCLFNMASRLGKYTGNSTYLDWAEKAYDWIKSVDLIDPKTYAVYDGVSVTDNCTSLNRLQWSYNFGVLLYGAACMWNVTGSDQWKKEVTSLLTGGQVFWPKGVLKEVACEDSANCNNDQKSFKAYTSDWMAETAKVAPFTEPTISPILAASAKAAAVQCSGGNDGVTCGMKWGQSTWDGSAGVGQQMAAMEIFNTQLAKYVAGPITNGDSGLSKSDPNAGNSATTDAQPSSHTSLIDMGDKAGAGILTFLFAATTIGGAVWVSL